MCILLKLGKQFLFFPIAIMALYFCYHVFGAVTFFIRLTLKYMPHEKE